MNVAILIMLSAVLALQILILLSVGADRAYVQHEEHEAVIHPAAVEAAHEAIASPAAAPEPKRRRVRYSQAAAEASVMDES